jgi:hypothetical protein
MERRLGRVEHLVEKGTLRPRRCRAMLGDAVREARRIAKRTAKTAKRNGSEAAARAQEEAERLLDRTIQLRGTRCPRSAPG